jgi:muconolactone D-isomerase
MEFLVRQTNHMPALSAEEVAEIKTRERAYAAQLREEGVLQHLWRVPGSKSAIGWYAADDITHLHDVLSSLPTFQWLEITVEPLATHPQEKPVENFRARSGDAVSTP